MGGEVARASLPQIGGIYRKTKSPRLRLDRREWRERLIDKALPVLAVAMARAKVAAVLTLGVDVRKPPKPKRRRKLYGQAGVRSWFTKATSATRWLDEHPEALADLEEAVEAAGVPGFSILTELPTVMKRRIANALTYTFKQDYWDDIAEATEGAAERILRSGLREGWSIRQMARQIEESLGSDEYARARSFNIARTESNWALNKARTDELRALQRDVPEIRVRRVWNSVLGTTTRPEHADLDGVPEDKDGTWELDGTTVACPGDPSLDAGMRCNCFPGFVRVSGDFVAASRCWYEGAVAEIVFASGTKLTLTPNHPVMTPDGFVLAGSLKPGDKVIAYDAKVDPPPRNGPLEFPLAARCYQVQDEPPAIEQVFEAFLAGSVGPAGMVEVRRSQVDDFHGDGKSVKGDVEVIRPDWELLDDGELGRGEESGDPVFVLPLSDLPDELGAGGHLSRCHRYGSSAGRLPGLAESLGGVGRPVRIGDVTPSGSLAIGVAADFDPGISESLQEEHSVVARLLRESLERYAGVVKVDEVAEIGYLDFAGHVYDLQSRYGVIVANDMGNSNGIVTHNCQCFLTTELGMDDDEAKPLIEDYYARVEAEREEED